MTNKQRKIGSNALFLYFSGLIVLDCWKIEHYILTFASNIICSQQCVVLFDLFCSSTVCPVAWLLLYFQGKKRKLSYVVQIVLEKVITQTNGNAAGRDSCHSYHEWTRAKVCCTILFICTCTGTIVCCPIIYGTIVQWLYNCTPRPMVVFVCCHFCLDAQVFHTAGARVCLFPTKGIQVQEYILGGMHFMKIHTRNEKSRNVIHSAL